MGHFKVVLGIIGLSGLLGALNHRHVDYGKYPPTVMIVGAARDTLNAAYAEYDRNDSSTTPYLEHGFCARSWTTIHPTATTTVLRVTDVVRSETDASPISVFIPCRQSHSNGAGIVFHTHPPQSCVIYGRWAKWSDCARMTDSTTTASAICQPSWLDYADTLQHLMVPARFIVCGHDRFVFYHATDAL